RSLFVKIRDAANAYFKKFFDENEPKWRYDSGSKPEIYFGMWSEIILRTTDAPEELMRIYDENLEPIEYCFNDSTLAAVVKKFFDKVGDTETLPSAYFQSRLGEIRRWQCRIKEALELAEAAYSKVEKLSLRDDERPFKIWVMEILADVLSSLERYTDEIPLREKIVAECERCFPDKTDERTIAAKEDLAKILEYGDRQNEALEIRREIFELFDERDGERYVEAAKDLAYALEENCDYEEALPIRKKILEFHENVHDDEAVVEALNRLIDTLENFSDEEHLKEQAECYRRYFELCEKIGWENSRNKILDFMVTLNNLGRDEEAEQIWQKLNNDSSCRIEDLKRRIEAFDEPNVETLELMNELAYALKEAYKSVEAEHWNNEIQTIAQTLFEQTCHEPIADYDAAISTLNALYTFMPRDKMIEVGRAILVFTEKKPGVEEAEIIEAKKELLAGLRCTEEHREEVNRLYQEIENYHKKNLPTSLDEFVNTLSYHASFFSNIDDYSAAIEKYKEALDLLENDSEPHIYDIRRKMNDIACVFARAENYSEELIWLERNLEFCREHFAEGAPEILDALDDLISAYKKELKDYAKAEQYSREVIAIKEKIRGDLHADTIKAKESLADILHDAEKYDEERKLLEEIVDLYREKFNMNTGNKEEYYSEFIDAGISLARSIFAAADELDKANRHDEATPERIKVLEQLNKILEETIEDCSEKTDHALA
ncbi:MAG: tetratricopeptide repeat protein, partial [Selenomonadaceae bacterium]|nr:tetratricopeptide repeat protein [Selenomonadaceae bacterium]